MTNKRLLKQKESLEKTLGELERYNTVIDSILSNKDKLIPGKNSTGGLEELKLLNEDAIKLNRNEIKKIGKKLKTNTKSERPTTGDIIDEGIEKREQVIKHGYWEDKRWKEVKKLCDENKIQESNKLVIKIKSDWGVE